ncbi:MAG: tRNA (uridine(54)-C5)-methyltransferase TrmA [Porticoccaceae bacterium]|nr:tRNA (uridine(54)-C5)-methyltransferase TrmA [Porticoccaceae bacterium]
MPEPQPIPAPPSVDAALATAPEPLSLAAKVAQLRHHFGRRLPNDLEVYPSPSRGYRMRAEFRIWHQGDRCHYAMHRPGRGGRPYVIDDYPPGSPAIADLMPRLLAGINGDAELRRRLFTVEFLTTTGGEALVTLIYHRALGAPWQRAASTLSQQLGCSLIGRSRGQRLVIGTDYVTETLTIAKRTYRWRQYETGFTQPNAAINREMLAWAARHGGGLDGDLLELYCGNGNFTLVMAGEFRRVLATEVAKLSVRAAAHNLRANDIGNVDLVRMASAEVGDALAGVRPFRRLSHLDLASYEFTTLLVDPPRAGLDAATIGLAENFKNILYISCNPLSLLNNVIQMEASHGIVAAAAFDQFPNTPHLECGILLRRR